MIGEIVPQDAPIVVEPVATPVASPPLLIVATAKVEDVQVTVLVTFRELPSL